MDKHYFAYEQWKNGQRTNIEIEVIVSRNISRSEAKRIADQEIMALRYGHRQEEVRGAIERKQSRMQSQIVRLPDYRFVGNN